MRLYLSWIALALAATLADLASPFPQSLPVMAGIIGVCGFWLALGAIFGHRALVAPLLIVSLGIAAVALWQALHGLPRPRGIFPSPNYLGSYACLCFFLAVQARDRWAAPLWWGFAGAVNLGALALSESRAAIAGLLIGLYWVVPRSMRRIWWGLLPFFLVLSYWIHPHWDSLLPWDDWTPRLHIWQLDFGAWQRREWTGWGHWPVWHGPLYPAYNIYLDWLVIGGILGLAAFLWCAAETFAAARGPLRGLIAAYLVNGLVFFDSAATALPVLAALCWIASERRNEALVPARVHKHQPFLHGGMGVERAD